MIHGQTLVLHLVPVVEQTTLKLDQCHQEDQGMMGLQVQDLYRGKVIRMMNN
jgi:hypothetical protein